MEAANEPLKGHFGGVGIEFNIVNDTVCVVSVIAGGPAEGVGILPGDKIISADGKKVSGVKIVNQDVMTSLKGESGTKVSVKIKRNNGRKLLDFSITRGTIPIYSVDFADIITDSIGYIKISRFAATTYDEYTNAYRKLQKQGMKKLIIDLRGNSGGLLHTAVDLADEFLSEDKEIVLYARGNHVHEKIIQLQIKGALNQGNWLFLLMKVQHRQVKY